MEKYLIIAFCVVIAVGIIYSIILTRKIKRDGLDAVAEVTRTETSESTDSEGFTETTVTYIVAYRTQEGEIVEGKLMNPKRGLAVGRRMRIKYLPEKKKSPVFIEYL